MINKDEPSILKTTIKGTVYKIVRPVFIYINYSFYHSPINK